MCFPQSEATYCAIKSSSEVQMFDLGSVQVCLGFLNVCESVHVPSTKNYDIF